MTFGSPVNIIFFVCVKLYVMQQKNVFFLLFMQFIIITLCAQNGTWTWMHGSNQANFTGNYGVQGISAPTNDPPAFYEVAEWTDLQGNFWIFGGMQINGDVSNSLWKFDPVTNEWTWVKGSQLPNQSGIYGTQGVPSVTNNPGSRTMGAVSWTDQSGDLWLFGGFGFDVNGSSGRLNDLWRYNISTNEWTWMKGSPTVNSSGSYGIQQLPSALNEPPARRETSASWVSSNGDLWLFGGDQGSIIVLFNDVWRYNIASDTWTWMSGSSTLNAPPNWGIQQVAAPSNTPGARLAYASWVDNSGIFWYFGGLYSDMWTYDPVTNMWTWVAGNNSSFSSVFQSQCQFTNDHPLPLLENRCRWKDGCGRLWSFGGFDGGLPYNLMWAFDPQQNQFCWVAGGMQSSQPGTFGTMLVPSATNYPPALGGNVGFVDAAGNFWMFGGTTGTTNYNTLWRYSIDPGCPATLVNSSAIATASDSVCASQAIGFAAVLPDSQYHYFWDFGDLTVSGDTLTATSGSYSYTTPGTYTVTLLVSGTNACGSFTDSVSSTVTVLPSPDLSLGSDTVFCGTFTHLLDAGNQGGDLLWSIGDTAQSVWVDAPGLYWATVTLNGCQNTDSVLIQRYFANDLGRDTSFCSALTITLDGGQGQHWNWNTGDTSRIINVNDAGTYSVQVINGPCTFSDTIIVSGTPAEGQLYFPNTFTPNGDGMNDVFIPEGSGITSFRMTVFDRWGSLLFETNSLSNGWDGRVGGNGVIAQIDTYIYVVEYTVVCAGSSVCRQIGHVNIIR